MTLLGSIFGETKASRMKIAIAELEVAVEGKRAEAAEGECRLKETLEDATAELRRSPLAGSLVWMGWTDV